MKKYLFIIIVTLCTTIQSYAGDGEDRIGINAGFLFPSTLNASLAFEHDLAYGNAFDLVGEMGNHWQTPACCRFWKGYYWDVGFGYKHRLTRYKNSMLRLRLGGQLGASQRNFFLGCNVSLEYDYVLPSGIRICIMQKNDFNFLHGDTFRNGLLIGLKVPF